MLFGKGIKKEQSENTIIIDVSNYNSKFSFLKELENSVKTDEEYAKYKGYMD